LPGTHTVTKEYSLAYPRPLVAASGDELRAHHCDRQFPGWIWCTTRDGQEGWVPQSWLSWREGFSYVLGRDYSAKELTVRAGDVVSAGRVESGWAWVTTADGESGWVPLRNLESTVRQLSAAELEAGLDEIRRAPKDQGRLELIVRRPAENEREALVSAELDVSSGLVGDNWRVRGSRHTVNPFGHGGGVGCADPDAQLTLMSSRVIALVAGAKERWPLAGDQLFVDLDLSMENLPAGTRLEIGSAVIEVAAKPHTGCGKFVARYGLDALKFVNSAVGKRLRLRGLNTRVVQAGVVQVGDGARKIKCQN